MSIVVVGLGPGPADWVTPAARAALAQSEARIFVRTALHPAVGKLLSTGRYESFDEVYERAASTAEVVEAVVDRLEQEGASGVTTVYAVPGDGAQGEGVVAALRDRGVQIRVVPGVAVAPSAVAAAGLPAVDGLQSVEATSLGGSGINLGVELNPRWPVVVTSLYSQAVAGEAKLAFQRLYPAGQAVTVVRHPGLEDERVVEMPLEELDRGRVELDHLTHVVLGPVPTEVPTGSPHGLRAIVARLRAPEIGCPWDLEQTHLSLIPYAIEEAYEVVDAIEHGTSADLMEELGDLLLQVALHAEMADQEGDFDWNDVVREISAKLVRRHPHVFGAVSVRGASDVVRNWDQLKAAEKANRPPSTSALEGVPRSFPALKRAAELGKKARKAGFDWPERAGALAKVQEELDELLQAESLEDRREEFGDLLWMLANLALRDGIDPEEALRAASAKFTKRFQEVERLGQARGWDSLHGRSIDELQALWDEAKQRVGTLPRPPADR